MVIRFKYKRGQELKYLAHLDMMKVFERALKRAGIEAAYSSGFNKRPMMVFGLPISLGMISNSEYADITLIGNSDPKEFMEMMNNVLPDGVVMLDVCALKAKGNIMSMVKAAEYTIMINAGNGICEAISAFMSRGEAVIEKEKKGQMQKKDIRKGILKAEYNDKEIKLLLSSGQDGHIKPEEFIKALYIYEDMKLDVESVIREEMYIGDEGGRLMHPFEEF